MGAASDYTHRRGLLRLGWFYSLPRSLDKRFRVVIQIYAFSAFGFLIVIAEAPGMGLLALLAKLGSHFAFPRARNYIRMSEVVV